MSEVFIVGFGLVSFFLLPWALTNANTDGDGLTMRESVLLVYGFVIVMGLSLVPKSLYEKQAEEDDT